MRFLKGVITLSAVSVGVAVFYVGIPIEARKQERPMEAALPDASAVFPWGVQIFESFSRDEGVNMFLALQERLPGIIGISPPMVIASRNYSMGTALRQRVYLGVASWGRGRQQMRCFATKKASRAWCDAPDAKARNGRLNERCSDGQHSRLMPSLAVTQGLATPPPPRREGDLGHSSLILGCGHVG